MLDEGETSEMGASTDPMTPKKTKARAKGKAPLSEADVKRSTRLKKAKKGFFLLQR
jgi:hypothetical protein